MFVWRTWLELWAFCKRRKAQILEVICYCHGSVMWFGHMSVKHRSAAASSPLWLKSYMYSGQAVDTILPGRPSGQHTIPSHSGEQKPSTTQRGLTFRWTELHSSKTPITSSTTWAQNYRGGNEDTFRFALPEGQSLVLYLLKCQTLWQWTAVFRSMHCYLVCPLCACTFVDWSSP